MPLSPSDWHNRFAVQAGWTSNTRRYLFNLAGISKAASVLDVGCGTGVLTGEIAHLGIQLPVGIDLDINFTFQAASHVPGGNFINSDALHLPFKRNAFDISFCHYVLMWVSDPLRMLNQMGRVTKPGSAVLALAEPDYGGRIDYPPELEIINHWQSASIQGSGGNPDFGRRLKELFHAAGFLDIEVGVIGAQWKEPPSPADIESEWRVIHHDLESVEKKSSEFLENLEDLKYLDIRAWANGERILYVPTFYALGRVPEGFR